MNHPDLTSRISNLEMLLTHHQREVAELNSVLIEQQRQIDELQRKLNQLARTPAPDPAVEANDPLIYDAPPPHW